MIKVTVNSNDLQKEVVYFCHGSTGDFLKTVNSNGVLFKTKDDAILSIPLNKYMVEIENVDE